MSESQINFKQGQELKLRVPTEAGSRGTTLADVCSSLFGVPVKLTPDEGDGTCSYSGTKSVLPDLSQLSGHTNPVLCPALPSRITVDFPSEHWPGGNKPVMLEGYIRATNKRPLKSDLEPTSETGEQTLSMCYDIDQDSFMHTLNCGTVQFHLWFANTPSERSPTSEVQKGLHTARVTTELGVRANTVAGWLQDSTAEISEDGVIKHTLTDTDQPDAGPGDFAKIMRQLSMPKFLDE